MPRGAIDQEGPQAGHDDSRILDGTMGKHRLHVVVCCGVEDSHQRRDAPNDQGEHARSVPSVNEVGIEPQNSVEAKIERDAGENRDEDRRGGRIRPWKPEIDGNQAGLYSKPEESEKKHTPQRLRRKPGSRRTQSGKREIRRGSAQNKKGDDNGQKAGLTHSQHDVSRRLVRLPPQVVVEQQKTQDRHALPANQEERRIAGHENQHNRSHQGKVQDAVAMRGICVIELVFDEVSYKN